MWLFTEDLNNKCLVLDFLAVSCRDKIGIGIKFHVRSMCAISKPVSSTDYTGVWENVGKLAFSFRKGRAFILGRKSLQILYIQRNISWRSLRFYGLKCYPLFLKSSLQIQMTMQTGQWIFIWELKQRLLVYVSIAVRQSEVCCENCSPNTASVMLLNCWKGNM